MNETRLWFCDISDKTIIFNFISYKRKEKYGILLKKIIKPKNHEKYYKLDDTDKNCRKKLIQLNIYVYMIFILQILRRIEKLI